ncbi:MAG: anaerobic ribonucleoside-triphosphate reductase activating protein [Caldisericum sp.]|uniref:anaerobic ribonucleoside-triphosphate reductase activating protein n=1 Tax=Caldisericum sp. TaxID=2499687 RepID=UPI003D14F0F3
MNNIRIGAMQKFSLVDYPDKTCAIIFTIGCNFRCPFCHNRELVLEKEFPNEIPFEDIIDFLETRKGLLDAVEFTGGEPLIHKGLIDTIKRIKDMGFLVKLDTNGSFPKRLIDLLPFVDYIAMDIKAPLEKYSEATGVKIESDTIKESIQIIKASEKDYEFRTTVFKNYFKTIDDFVSVGNLINRAKAYYIQRPHFDKVLNPNYPFETFTDKELQDIQALMKQFADTVEIR